MKNIILPILLLSCLFSSAQVQTVKDTTTVGSGLKVTPKAGQVKYDNLDLAPPIVTQLNAASAEASKAAQDIQALFTVVSNFTAPEPVNVTTTTYTLQASDYGKTIRVLNVCLVTIPTNIPVKCKIIRAGGIVTITSVGNLNTPQGLRKVAANNAIELESIENIIYGTGNFAK